MNKKIMRITVHSHHFTVSKMDGSIRVKIEKFLNQYRKYEYIKRGRRFKRVVTKVFASWTNNKQEYRLHINQLHPFMYFLGDNYVKAENIEIVRTKKHKYRELNVSMKDHIVPRGYQIPYIKYLIDDDDESPISKLLSLQTGKGKGIVSLWSICKLNKVTAIVVLPKYIEKWHNEIKDVTSASDDDIITVRGGDQIRGLIELANNGELKAKFIIFSNRTLLNYIKNYENTNGILSNMDYEVKPDDLMKVLGIGLLLFDEVHQDFHGNFKISLYMNLDLIIGLSATLTSEDKFLLKMYSVMFPYKDRPKELIYDKYVRMLPVSYRLGDNIRLNSINYGTNSYSHVEYEKSIMRNYKVLKDYLKMIDYFVRLGYIGRRKEGDKLAIFASTVKMCSLITNFIKDKYPNLSVERYVEDDPFSNIIEPDIRVTTVLSGGTAVDIPGLITVLQTINVSSLQSNIQTYGRLRKKKGKDMYFYYLYCTGIQKHVDYHNNRMKVLGPRASSVMELTYDYAIGSDGRDRFMNFRN